MNIINVYIPAISNTDSMLAQRRRRWANIESALAHPEMHQIIMV